MEKFKFYNIHIIYIFSSTLHLYIVGSYLIVDRRGHWFAMIGAKGIHLLLPCRAVGRSNNGGGSNVVGINRLPGLNRGNLSAKMGRLQPPLPLPLLPPGCDTPTLPTTFVFNCVSRPRAVDERKKEKKFYHATHR